MTVPKQTSLADGQSSLVKGQTSLVAGQTSLSPLRAAGAYDPDAAAFMARFIEPATNERKALINSQFIAGKARPWWAKCDAIYVHAAHGQAAGRLNWLADKWNCAPVNGPVFTVDRGYFPNGSTSYLDTQFNPAIEVPLGSKFQRDSGTIAVRSNTDNASTGSLAGFFDAVSVSGITINPRQTNDRTGTRVNQGTAREVTFSSPTAIGLFVATRTGPLATDQQIYRNGATPLSGVITGTASVAPVNGNLRLGSISNSSYRSCQFSGGLIGAGFTDQDAIDYDNWMDTWLSATGVI